MTPEGDVGDFPKLRVPFLDPNNKDHRILGSILGSQGVHKDLFARGV